MGSLPGGNFSNALAINSEGDVTGQTSSGSGNFGFLYKNGTMQELVPPAGQTSSSGLAINDSDQIAGFSANPAIWNGPNSPQTLFTNGIDAQALAINNAGEAAGYSYESPAWIWTPATGKVSIGTLGGENSTAWGINQLGDVVGESQDRSDNIFAFLWTPQNGMVSLGGNRSYAYAINNSEQVVGYMENSEDDGTIAFLWDPVHGLQSIGPGTAYGINNHGQVVGVGNGGAMIWDSINGMQNLNSLIPANSGIFLNQANGINDSGEIVGTGVVGGEEVGFILTPVPEPGSFSLLLAGLAGMLIYVRRQTA